MSCSLEEGVSLFETLLQDDQKGIVSNHQVIRKIYQFIENTNSPEFRDIIEKSAYSKNRVGQFVFAIMCHDINLKLAWLLFSASQGYSYAQNGIGNIYYNDETYKYALKWYELSAKQGNPFALSTLGSMYYGGEGVSKDRSKTLELLKIPVEQGVAESQNLLGFMFENGITVELNLQKAIELYTLAASQGNSMAQWNLGNMFEFGRGVETNLKTALEWYELAAQSGDPDSCLKLVEIYEDGDKGFNVEPNLDKALKYLLKVENYSKSTESRIREKIRQRDFYPPFSNVLECSICLLNGVNCSIKCGHTFCHVCALKMKSCPICRASFDKKEINRLFLIK